MLKIWRRVVVLVLLISMVSSILPTPVQALALPVSGSGAQTLEEDPAEPVGDYIPNDTDPAENQPQQDVLPMESLSENTPETTPDIQGEDPDNGDSEENIMPVDGTEPAYEGSFTIKTSIEYASDKDWESLVRPSRYTKIPSLIPYYADPNGGDDIKGEPISLQVLSTTDPLFYSIRHDGNGGGNIQIENVPTKINGEEVAYYKLDAGEIDFYNEPQGSTIAPKNGSTVFGGGITYTLKTAEITLSKQIPGTSGDTTSFPVEYKASLASDQTTTITKNTSVKAGDENKSSVTVPVGLYYSFTEKNTDGYKYLRTELKTTETPEEGEPVESESALTEPFLLEEGKSYEVVFTNASMNVKPEIAITWIDNHQTEKRNTLSLKLMVQINGEGEYTELTAENCREILGIDTLPDLKHDEQKNTYYYEGLPAASENGENIFTYRIDESAEGYVCTQNEDGSYTNRLMTSFSATIQWNDSWNRDEYRPTVDQMKNILHMYRYVNGEPELVDIDLNIVDNGNNSWTITNAGPIPEFNDKNEKYEYFIVEEIVNPETGECTPTFPPLNENVSDGTTTAHYVTKYYNGQGAFGNETNRCHNGQIIYHTIEETIHFTAKKVWKDDGKQIRPDAIVTLYRYPMTQDKTYPETLEDASRVVVKTDAGDVLLSYHLDTNNESSEEEIDFVKKLIEDKKLPEGYALPKYDEKGNEYYYFVRETFANAEKAGYKVSYVPEDENQPALTFGTGNGGEIDNTRNAIGVVHVDKSWSSPSEINDYANKKISIALKVEKTTTDNETGDTTTVYDTVTAVPYKTQTGSQEISGFTGGRNYSDTDFFVNLYDENGMPYNFVGIEETSITDATNLKTTYDENGSPVTTFTLNGHSYTGTSTRKADTTNNQYDGLQQINYELKNSISDPAVFSIEKIWGEGVTKQDLKFTITGTSIAPNPITKTYEYSMPLMLTDDTAYATQTDCVTGTEEGKLNLPKYDENGYLFEYRAEEITVPENCSADYEYLSDKTIVRNTVNGGPVYKIHIQKEWIDDGDAANRQPVTYIVTGTDNEEIATGTLSADMLWETTIVVPYDPKTYDYTVTETKVGEAEVNAKDGTVTNDAYTYAVSGRKSDDGTDFTLVNRKTGKLNIEIVKNWVDGNNSNDTRPDTLPFVLKQNGQLYTNTEMGIKDGAVNISNPAKAESRGILSGLLDLFRSGEQDANPNRWTYRIENLPLYDDNGKQYRYELIESDDFLKEEKSADYESVYDGCTYTVEDPDREVGTYTYTYSNTLKGTTGFTVYKIWRDAATGGTNRPDLYLTLYRTITPVTETNPNPEGTVYTDYEDQLWTPAGASDVYNWKIEINNLPKYDEEGNKYTYYIIERMNNDGKMGDVTYKTHYCDGPTIDDLENHADKTANRAYEGDYIINYLYDEMKVLGTKSWVNTSGYVSAVTDLPSPTMELRRYLESDVKKAEASGLSGQQAKEAVWVKVDELTLDENYGKKDKGSYEFPTSNYVNTTGTRMFPKYSPTGERYVYEVVESIPSKTQDISVFTVVNKNNSLTNTYNITENTRKIIVEKTWDRGELSDTQSNAYPNVKYVLYRYEKPEDGKPLSDVSKMKEVARGTIYADRFSEHNGAASYTFDDLRLYAPDGELYYYHIEELPINGYTISYSGGDGDNRNGIDITDLPNVDGHPVMDGKAERTVGSKNTYDQKGEISVNGEKIWNDYENAYGYRPSEITVTLKRYTSAVTHPENGSDLGNKVKEESVDLTGKITWTKETDKWSYVITNLEKYAPNGKPYIYCLTESPVPYYNLNADGNPQGQSTNPVSAGNANASGAVTLSALTNSLSGTYAVRKDWIDGENLYGFRPATVTIQLQRKENGTWVNVEKAQFRHQNGTVEATNGIVQLSTEKDSMPRTNDCSWIGTFINLPVYALGTDGGIGEKYEYRCVETEIGDLELCDKNKNPSIEGEAEAGPYTRSYIEQTATNTLIENKMKTTKLTVTKEWTDEDNLYRTRPSEITVKMQRAEKPAAAKDDWRPSASDWIDVKTANTLKITAEEGWTHTFENLPVCTIDSDALTLYYRVVETKANGTTVLATLKNYQDLTKYDRDSSENIDWSYDPNTNVNSLKLSNEMIPSNTQREITVIKKWFNSDNTAPQTAATFELKHKHENDTTFTSFETPVTNEIRKQDGSVTWVNLTDCDAVGRKWYYRVEETNLPENYAVVKRTTTETTDSVTKQTDTFYNVELQDLTLTKNWEDFDNTYGLRSDLTLTLKYRDVGSKDDNDWKEIPSESSPAEFAKYTASAPVKNGNTWEYTYSRLPKYRVDDDGNKVELEYKVEETEPENYIRSYDDNGGLFVDGKAEITNTLVYGYVNLKKVSAEDGTATSVALVGTVFEIYKVSDTTSTLYTTVTTDSNGNIPVNPDGSYGDPGKHLVPGTYTLKETKPVESHSIVQDSVSFTVSKTREETNPTGTGDQGLAWIAADETSATVMYLAAAPENETVYINNTIRGAATFSKTEDAEGLSATDGYFGVYTTGDNPVLVASMQYNTKAGKYVLSNKDSVGNDIAATNDNGVAYLWTPNTDTDTYFYLLSGTYTVKEEIAPSGYVLDTTQRSLTISGTSGYANTGTISDLTGTGKDQWENSSNKLVITKPDQYGRNVTLGDTNYLTLTAETGKTFANTTLSEIHLYQNATTPVKDSAGTAVSTLDVTWSDNKWTIRHLFVPGVTYTLSEGTSQTPENYFTAGTVSFTFGTDGKLASVNGAKESDNTAVSVGNTDTDTNAYANLYKSDVGNNAITLRDVERFAHASITKVSGTAKVGNISFKLYKCAGTEKSDQDIALLGTNEYFVTDANGVINTANDTRINPDTQKAFKYGLTPGTYYLVEQERGASDKYQINKNPIYFTVTPDKTTTYASDKTGAVFATTGEGWKSGETATIGNPVVPKTLEVEKTDVDGGAKLAGAEFDLTYTSVNNGQTGAEAVTTYKCITNENGELVLADASGNATTSKPDIRNKGTYVLKETKAPSGYTLAEENLATIVVSHDDTTNKNVVTITANSARTTVGLDNKTTVTNKKTSFLVKKQDNAGTPAPVYGATMSVYKWDAVNKKVVGDALQTLTTKEDNGSVLNFIGIPEDTLCVIQETTRPYGYETAAPVYFKLAKSISGDGMTYANTGSDLILCNEAGTVITATNVTTTTIGKGNNTTTLKQVAMTDDVINVPVTLKKVRVVTGADNTTTASVLEGAEFSIKKVVNDTAVDTTEIKAITNANGILVTNDTAKTTIVLSEGKYQATETSAPANTYCDGRTYTFTVNETDYTAYKADTTKIKNIVNDTLEKDLSVNAENKAFKAVITLKKVDATSDAGISGTEFTLDDNGTKTRYTTGTDGTLTIEVTHKGSYTLTETNPASGYHMTDPVYNKTITIADANYYELANSTTALGEISNTRKTGTLTIYKKDGDTNAAIDDVTFDLYKKNEGNVFEQVWNFITGNKYTFQSTTSESTTGVTTIEGLTWGEYYLIEKTESAGYVLTSDEYHFNVNATTVEKAIELSSNASSLKENNVIMNYKNKMTFKKTNEDRETLTGGTYRILDGDDKVVEFYTSAKETGGKFTSFTATTDGVSLYGIPAGTYYLQETEAPAGYMLDSTKHRFEISHQGVVSSDDTAVTIADNVLTMKNSKIAITLTKQNISEDDLSGARFSVSGIFAKADGTHETESTTIEEITVTEFTDKLKGKLIATTGKTEGTDQFTYTLTEDKAPDGYGIVYNVSFTVDTEGKITITGGDNGVAEAYKPVADNSTATAVLKLVDPKIELKLRKTDEEGKAINGVTLTLTDTTTDAVNSFAGEANGVSTKDFTTDTNGEVDLAGILLHGHVYTLKETKAADGFTAREEALATITVEDHGTPVMRDLDVDVTAEDGVITVTNKKTSFLVKKQDENGEFVSDATMSIYKADDLKKPVETWKTMDEVQKVEGLSENTLYVIKEDERPFDHETAAPVYFKLSGSIAGEGNDYSNTASGLLICDKDGNEIANPKNVTFEKNDGKTIAQIAITDDNIRVPVSLQKMRENADGENKPLENAIFEIRKLDDEGNEIEDSMIPAVTNEKGRLVHEDGTDIILSEGKYQATETSAPANTYCDGRTYTFTVNEADYTAYKADTTKIKNIANDTLEKEFREEVKNLSFRTQITVTLTDKDTGEPIEGGEFTLFEKNENGTWSKVTSSVTDEKGKLTFDIEKKNEYMIVETTIVDGYQIKTPQYSNTFTVTDKDYNNPLRDDVTDERTELVFHKYGMFNESCADGTEIDPNEEKALSGVTFAAYAVDEDGTVADSASATVKSDEDGTVAFYNLPLGRYQVKEIETIYGYRLDETPYYADVISGKFEGLYDENNNPVTDNKLVNDIYRTDVYLKKVDEKDPSKVLANSRYGLFRRFKSGFGYKEVLVCTAVTDEEGYILFKGVCIDSEYVIRELEAPAGSYVSKEPVTLVFGVDSNGEVELQEFKDGNGTAEVINGEIVWYEPPVEVDILKTDKEGKPLAGALLKVVDEDGNEIARWTSEASAKRFTRLFIIGKTYQLIELEAPKGYELAEPVSFTISDAKVGPNEDKLVNVVMVDEATPKKQGIVDTGVESPIAGTFGILMMSMTGIFFVLKKKWF